MVIYLGATAAANEKNPLGPGVPVQTSPGCARPGGYSYYSDCCNPKKGPPYGAPIIKVWFGYLRVISTPTADQLPI